jgi:MFS family permease
MNQDGTFKPAGTLRNRTFIGLLIAQFLAAFNDQAIHAAAMFFAIKTGALSQKNAISLMPILFYMPWGMFCTLAGYYADKFSKRQTLIFWKFAEVIITIVATVGFALGGVGEISGPWIVMLCVFLMGMHSAFFVPAKYGSMPEILQPHLLSRGNGILESLSFLAVILGTVFGGVLSDVFALEDSIWIGVILTLLAIIGAAASLLIQKMPAANPDRSFPKWIYAPLWTAVKTLFSTRPLVFAQIGLIFFTFVVAFMRATVYMLGESQDPVWEESKTSAIVGCVALGIGFGSPIAGWLSGRKIEPGLLPLGTIGMMIGCVCAGMFLQDLPYLVMSIILIGFATGFYLVPLYTLLQFRAPKQSKGDMIAISNFMNVTGAISASVLFKFVVEFADAAKVPRPQLPSYLFIGAGCVTLLIAVAMMAVLPDLIKRMFWVLRSMFEALFGKRVDIHGLGNLPAHGKFFLVAETHSLHLDRAIRSSCDRPVRYLDESFIGHPLRLVTELTDQNYELMKQDGRPFIPIRCENVGHATLVSFGKPMLLLETVEAIRAQIALVPMDKIT